MNPYPELRQFLAQRATRRTFLGRTAQGIGGLALASLLNPTLLSAATATARKDKWTGAAYPLDYPQKVKRVIWLTMAGGPSHLETFDYKPKLAKMHGEPMPDFTLVGTDGKEFTLSSLRGKHVVIGWGWEDALPRQVLN